MKDCSHCGIAKPIAEFGANKQRKDERSSFCKTCASAVYKRTRLRDKSGPQWEEILERQRVQTRRYRAANPDAWRAQQERAAAKRKLIQLTEAQKQAVRDRALRWHYSHPTEARALRLKWARENPERSKAHHRKSVLTRRAKQREAFIESVDPGIVFDRAGGICGICREAVERNQQWEVDHVVPLSKGGAHSYDNVQIAHRKCNRSKGAKLPLGHISLFQKVGR